MVAGPSYRLVVDLASCMRKGGAGFYVRQGWTGGGWIWEWDSEAVAEAVAAAGVEQSSGAAEAAAPGAAAGAA